MSCLVLPVGPVDAAGEHGAKIDLTRAHCRGGYPTAGVPVSHETWRGLLRIGAWRNAGEGGVAAFSRIDGERWLNVTWNSVSHLGDDTLAGTGPRPLTGRDLLPGGGFLFSAGDAATPEERWSDGRQPAPVWSAGALHADGARPIGLFGSDCERDRPRAGETPTGMLSARRILGVYVTDDLMMTESRGTESESPLRHRSTAIGMPLAPPDMRRVPSTSVETAGHRAALRPDGWFGLQMAAGPVPGATGVGRPEAAGTGRVRRWSGAPRGGLGAGAAGVGLEVALRLDRY